ncbi:MAG TPA: nucleotidyltransferase domain-containing protein [Thermoanaerobaculia bacterium]|nr:nucleotidyltransferase domain-containing protein [Thermoanaerobaculia bacterium]
MDALPPEIAEHLDEVRTLCEKYSVKRLTLFGSAVKGTFDPATSDLDFAVEFFPHPDPLVRGDRYWDLLFSLQTLFARDIDLVVLSSVKNPYFIQVLEMTQRSVYEAA